MGKLQDKNIANIVDLFLAKINGSISLNNEKKLDKWRDSSNDNKDLYDKLLKGQDYHEFVAYNKLFKDESKTDAFIAQLKIAKQKEAIERKLKYSNNRFLTSRNSKNTFLYVLSAACAIVLIVISITIFTNKEKDINNTLNIINPGSSRATLVLSSGEKILLGENNETVIDSNLSVLSLHDTLSYKNSKLTKISKDIYHTLVIPRGGEYIVKLSDGTKIWLNSDSKLKYPIKFNGTTRKVYLEGEAYFEVAKNKSKPFIVQYKSHKLTVTGTVFSIRAYSDENNILTTLESGSVNVEIDKYKYSLKPDEQSIFNTKTQKTIISKVRAWEYTIWHNEIFFFDDESLESIMKTLARWYNISVFYENEDLKNIRFNGQLKRYSNVNGFLDKIQKLKKVRFNIKGRCVVVSTYN